MSHTAIVLSRSGAKWTGDELDIHEVEDLDELADLMRDFGDGQLTLLFIEEDDEYVAVVRLEGDDDPRGFISDARCLDASTKAATIFDGALEIASQGNGDPDDDGDEDDENEDQDDESEAPEIEPAGEANILSDLGVSEAALLGLCSAEGNLPADVISAVCERLGCADELERIRGL